MMKIDSLFLVRSLVRTFYIATDEPERAIKWVRSLHNRKKAIWVKTQHTPGGYFEAITEEWHQGEKTPLPEGPAELSAIMKQVLADDPRDGYIFYLVTEDPRWLSTPEGVEAINDFHQRAFDDDRAIRFLIFVGNKEQTCPPELDGVLLRVSGTSPLPGGLKQRGFGSERSVLPILEDNFGRLFREPVSEELIGEVAQLVEGFDDFQIALMILGMAVIQVKSEKLAITPTAVRDKLPEVIEALERQCGWPQSS